MVLHGALLASLWISAFFGLIFYVYFSMALMTIAKKTGTDPAWLAWIPIFNLFLMVKIAEAPLWSLLLLLLVFIPFIGWLPFLGVMIWWWWKIAERRGKPGWFALLFLIPLVNLIVVGVIAWHESGPAQATPPATPPPTQ